MTKRKPGERWRQMGREMKMLNAKKSGKPAIPDRILRELASLNLPPDRWVYDVVLQALLEKRNPSSGVSV